MRGLAFSLAGCLLALAKPAAAKDGLTVFRAQCAVCHAVTANSPPGLGPRLFGVVGRKAGSLPGYTYSPAMKAAGFIWTPEKLKAYLAAPQAVVKGNKMSFAGLRDPGDSDAVVSYLATLH